MGTDINKVVLIGRLTRDCGQQDFSYIQGKTAKANISIAVNRSRKQGEEWVEEVSFFDISIFEKMAENLHPYLTKGKQICVEGHLKQDRWTDQQGNHRSRISIIADNIELLGGKNDGSGKNASQMAASAEDTGEFAEDIQF